MQRRERRGAHRLIALFIVVMTAVVPLTVRADEASDTVNQLNSANTQAAETSQHISDINSQLSAIEAQIADTQQRIADTNAAIVDAQQRMAASQAKLNDLMRAQYQGDNQQTKLEQLVGSSNLSDFVNKETYLQAGQDKLDAAVAAVLATKHQLESRAAELNTLNTQLAAAQNGLNFQRAQAQGQLDQINAARAELKAKLARYAGGRVVQNGDQVRAGDLIGFEGTSGCSTGPHVHFEVDVNGTPQNPRTYTPGRLRWPVDAGFGIAQEFGKPSWSAPYSFHTGMDLTQYFGAPVYAAGDGTVVFSGYDRSGFGDHVIIDHGGGMKTIYGHLGPRASDYPNC